MTHLGPFGTTWYKYRICTCFSCQMGPLGYPKILPWDLIFFFLESGSYMHAFRHMNREGYFWRSKNRKSGCDPAVLVVGPQYIDFWASIHIWKLPWKAEGNQNPMTTPSMYKILYYQMLKLWFGTVFPFSISKHIDDKYNQRRIRGIRAGSSMRSKSSLSLCALAFW